MLYPVFVIRLLGEWKDCLSSRPVHPLHIQCSSQTVNINAVSGSFFSDQDDICTEAMADGKKVHSAWFAASTFLKKWLPGDHQLRPPSKQNLGAGKVLLLITIQQCWVEFLSLTGTSSAYGYNRIVRIFQYYMCHRFLEFVEEDIFSGLLVHHSILWRTGVSHLLMKTVNIYRCQ